MARKILLKSSNLETILNYGKTLAPIIIGTGAILTYVSLKTLPEEYGNFDYHAIGFVMGTMGRIADKMSTHAFLKTWNKYKDSHPKECGQYLECNFIIRRKLKFEDFYSKMPFSDFVSENLSFFFPAFGASYLVMSPYIVWNNLKHKKSLEEECK